MKAYAGVAQLAEQLICNQQVAGSSPIASSILFARGNIFFMDGFPSGQREQTVNLPSPTSVVRIHPHPLPAGMAELADALDSGSSEGFLHAGSSPVSRTRAALSGSFLRFIPASSEAELHKYGWVPEWPKGADCKSAVTDFGGSNPPPSTACGNGGIGRRARFRF